ncbi:exodeoxyribonuclease III [Marinicella gelatinilytica]|uniref:exodeoxyribonuclease III n=1 Tax=Marinicella gelatinilytica TaxID=2996017 RepID=UPI002260AD68|nr:exodeoxyribonuclease III [Marinicella gelatinilytica]MCX7545378.1 exodeoxyribonuclease III [Marinicella gelatinilytica]
MKIASWNVNSLKVRLPQVLEWLQQEQPDVLALQETKLTDDVFPIAGITEAGYQVVFSGQKTYNGVAIIAKNKPQDIITDIDGLDDPQRRIIAATIEDIRVVNLYVVNGQAPGTEKFAYKLNWLEKVTDFLNQQLDEFQNVIVLGDFNIAPDDRDVHDPEYWHEKILCTTEERNALSAILNLGFQDTFRLLHDEGGFYSWWDYRMNKFARGMGLRIDLILAADELSETLQAAYIDVEPRKNERPSDHTPVVAEFDW